MQNKIYFERTLKIILKGTVSVTSGDPPCKDGNAQFVSINDNNVFNLEN